MLVIIIILEMMTFMYGMVDLIYKKRYLINLTFILK